MRRRLPVIAEKRRVTDTPPVVSGLLSPGLPLRTDAPLLSCDTPFFNKKNGQEPFISSSREG